MQPDTLSSPREASEDERAEPLAPSTDIRATRPYVLSRGTLRTFARRLLGIATLALLDAVGLALGLYSALVLRSLVFGNDIFWGLLWEAGPQEWLPFLIPITLLVFWQAGLYASRERRAGAGRVASSLVLVAAIVLAFGWGTGYDFTTSGLIPTACVTSALLIGGLRTAYDSATIELQRLLNVRRRVLLVGEGESLRALHRVLAAARGTLAYEFAGTFSPDRDGPIRDRLEDLSPDELILNEGDFDEQTVLAIVEAAHRCGVRVRIAPKTTELLLQRGEYVPGQGAPLFELRPPVLAGADWAVKRTFDLVVSGVAIVLGLPLWLLIALAIKLDSRGPILYRDRRVGIGERDFEMLKFRTMVQGAAELQQELEARNEAGGALFKIRDDPRVTRVGRFLRRFSMDELPQVLNVLRGEMSLVGPRPLPLRDYRQLQEWHRRRYNVLPGITGLWQISGRSNLTFDDLVRLDFYYIENWSIWLDISILAKTLPAVVAARGAY
ncbi:MAG TPA: sugar transferase [Gaiellaceae bacterium]|nr:sugar transferase [Gaiellaceae bacterium]